MRLTQLNNIEIFLQVAKNKSFIASAKELGLSPSAISASIRKLEEYLNVPLIVRTTRSVALTDAGE
jgi:DNA-binding transcriptional LysR family regulator